MITVVREVALSLAVLAVVLCAVGAGSQESTSHRIDPRKDYALIYGTVWDAQNRPAYGITVKIRRADEKKARWELMSDHAGEFAQRVPPGKQDYVIWAEVKKHKTKEKPQTVAHVENDERVDVSLHLTK